MIPPPKVPVLKGRRDESRKKTYLALVELFAGLRTTHLAAQVLEEVCIVMSHAAEKCDFANRLAVKNKVDEVVHTDVKAMGEAWAASFVEEAKKKECQVILVMAGFPCKGLSRNRIDNLPTKGFDHPDTALFSEIPRILSLLKRLANPLGIAVHHIIENVKITDKADLDHICSVLNGIPTMIQASRSCGSSRPRLWWCSFELTPLKGETFEKGDRTNVLNMVQVPEKTLAAFWDPKWGPSKDFRLPFPCICGWSQKPRSPKESTTVGFDKASNESKQRWKEDGWATGLVIYEERNMAHSLDGANMRVVSPTECERLLGFQPGWTNPGEKSSPGIGYQRRNAIGNAFAVPVVTRLLLALSLVVQGEGLSAFPAWANQDLAAPYRHDVLDDIFAEASFLAEGYKDLVSEFDSFLQPHWGGDLVGADPGAGGKKNRTQRTAAVGVQKNTHLSRDGLQLLIQEPRLDPLEHVDAALNLVHPFASSPELPWDLKFAAERSAIHSVTTDELRAHKLNRLRKLAEDCKELDQRARDRMSPEVKVASSTINLGFLSALIHIIRWPDWQLPALFARGFKVAGDIEPSNVYPRVASAAVESAHSLLDSTEADKWNTQLAEDTRPSDLDNEVYKTAEEQSTRGLLSKPMSKTQVDKFFGKGCWKGIRRRGIDQHGKCRGIDNARSSRTNFSAWLEETISTAPQDIGIQIVCWLFQGKIGIKNFKELKNFLKVYLTADDLMDAYHGCPNDPTQLCFCVVAILNPRKKEIEFYLSTLTSSD